MAGSEFDPSSVQFHLCSFRPTSQGQEQSDEAEMLGSRTQFSLEGTQKEKEILCPPTLRSRGSSRPPTPQRKGRQAGLSQALEAAPPRSLKHPLHVQPEPPSEPSGLLLVNSGPLRTWLVCVPRALNPGQLLYLRWGPPVLGELTPTGQAATNGISLWSRRRKGPEWL